MNKKRFITLVVLMSVALLGIIFVQSYFIIANFNIEKKQFSRDVTRALTEVSSDIEDVEISNFYRKLQPFLNLNREIDSLAIKEYLVFSEDENNNETIFHKNTIIEKNLKLPVSLLEYEEDTIQLKRFSSFRQSNYFQKYRVDNDLSIRPVKSFKEYSNLSNLDRNAAMLTYNDLVRNDPVYKRISARALRRLISNQLTDNGVNLDFEFAVYDNNLATKLKSEKFKFSKGNQSIRVFKDNQGESNFNLYVNFPKHERYLLSTLSSMIILAIIFTAIIIIVFISALYQLINQRRISQIKSDFINNMTHEFKTPIATINLALDFIKSPGIMENKDQVNKYLAMIKEENKRMHTQVENVLRISKIENNQFRLKKEKLKINDLIEEAIAHVQLIVENKNGYIKTHFITQQEEVEVHITHMVNVFVNILDNAIKYSDKAPEIDIYTKTDEKFVFIDIADNGIGMTKNVQRQIFDKFYREQSGNIHNVKGHGLGLAYVKKIIDKHSGKIYVESELGQGSVFKIQIPLI